MGNSTILFRGKRFYWQKPYSRIKEGIVGQSIIAFGKRPHYYEYMASTEDSDGKNYPTTTQWSYTLYLDLWILKIRLDWLGKLATPNTKRGT